jgi:hypothetical protein
MNAPAIRIHKPVREQVSKEEWQTRVDLAACYRLMHEFGMVEMIANHISARVPGTQNEFLMTLSCNTEIELPPQEVVNEAWRLFQPGVRRRFGLLEWPALLRKLDKVDTSYKN